jgi:D-Tyr-tRNAtyr deacylase
MFPQKPDFHGALGGDQAKELYQLFVSKVQQGYKPERVKDGVFQAMMVRLLSRVSGFCGWDLTMGIGSCISK